MLDCLFVDGDDVLFQIALALLANVEDELLECDDMAAAVKKKNLNFLILQN